MILYVQEDIIEKDKTKKNCTMTREDLFKIVK